MFSIVRTAVSRSLRRPSLQFCNTAFSRGGITCSMLHFSNSSRCCRPPRRSCRDISLHQCRCRVSPPASEATYCVFILGLGIAMSAFSKFANERPKPSVARYVVRKNSRIVRSDSTARSLYVNGRPTLHSSFSCSQCSITSAAIQSVKFPRWTRALLYSFLQRQMQFCKSPGSYHAETNDGNFQKICQY